MRDELYVRARTALLDTVEALGPHLDAVVLVGAQAVYLHTGDANFAVAEYTTDGDFAISPVVLADEPLLGDAPRRAGFTAGDQPGEWLSTQGIRIDLMVPEALAGTGRRSAQLGVHGKRAARRARGLEGALVDRERHEVVALDPADGRSVTMWVAGPGALSVAKVHKIAERVDHQDRVRDKDALDPLRLLRAIDTDDMTRQLRRLANDELAGEVTREALAQLVPLFGMADSDGVTMAIRAAGGAEDDAIIADSFVALVEDLRAALA